MSIRLPEGEGEKTMTDDAPRIVLKEMMKREDWWTFIEVYGDLQRWSNDIGGWEKTDLIPIDLILDTTGLLRDKAIEWLKGRKG